MACPRLGEVIGAELGAVAGVDPPDKSFGVVKVVILWQDSASTAALIDACSDRHVDTAPQASALTILRPPSQWLRPWPIPAATLQPEDRTADVSGVSGVERSDSRRGYSLVDMDTVGSATTWLRPQAGARYVVQLVTGGFADEGLVGLADVELVLQSDSGDEARCALGGPYSGQFKPGGLDSFDVELPRVRSLRIHYYLLLLFIYYSFIIFI